MNANTGQMFIGDPEFLKSLEKDASKEAMKKAMPPNQCFVEIEKENIHELEAMSLTERKAWAKRERKRLRRLKERDLARKRKSGS